MAYSSIGKIGIRGFRSYLAAMSHSKRKRSNRKRRKVQEASITFEKLTGAALTRHIGIFYSCYAKTYREHNSPPHLNLAFFSVSAR